MNVANIDASILIWGSRRANRIETLRTLWTSWTWWSPSPQTRGAGAALRAVSIPARPTSSVLILLQSIYRAAMWFTNALGGVQKKSAMLGQVSHFPPRPKLKTNRNRRPGMWCRECARRLTRRYRVLLPGPARAQVIMTASHPYKLQQAYNSGVHFVTRIGLLPTALQPMPGHERLMLCEVLTRDSR